MENTVCINNTTINNSVYSTKILHTEVLGCFVIPSHSSAVESRLYEMFKGIDK